MHSITFTVCLSRDGINKLLVVLGDVGHSSKLDDDSGRFHLFLPDHDDDDKSERHCREHLALFATPF